MSSHGSSCENECDHCGEDELVDELLEECRGPGCSGSSARYCENCLEGCAACGLSVCPDRECSYSCCVCGILLCQRRRCCPESTCNCGSTMLCANCVRDDGNSCRKCNPELILGF